MSAKGRTSKLNHAKANAKLLSNVEPAVLQQLLKSLQSNVASPSAQTADEDDELSEEEEHRVNGKTNASDATYFPCNQTESREYNAGRKIMRKVVTAFHKKGIFKITETISMLSDTQKLRYVQACQKNRGFKHYSEAFWLFAMGEYKKNKNQQVRNPNQVRKSKTTKDGKVTTYRFTG
jgi:hypothetical protein